MKKTGERNEKYQGMERIQKGLATVFRDPVQKGDHFDHAGTAITKIYRGGKVLYAVGQKIKGDNGLTAEIIHLEVDPNPGNMKSDQAVKEGFDTLYQFSEAFFEAYGESALWRPAWRIECEIHQPVADAEPELEAVG